MPRKGNSGRKKGATSCIRVSLTQLTALLSDKATVLVNKRWAEQVGVSVRYEAVSMEGERVYATTENVNADSQLVDVQVNDLAEEKEAAAQIKSVDLSEESDEVIDW
jgi:hypothetical protein|tara:strand:+ start:6776 stop:7096 length:321 start_codon:yes stop_codon:yes gene_type:complete